MDAAKRDAELFRAAGARIRQLRLERNLTQHQVADRAGFTGSYITHIELGDSAPTLGTLRAIAEQALEVPLWRLLSDDRLEFDEKLLDATTRELLRASRGLSAESLQLLIKVAEALRNAPTARTSAHKRKPKR